MSVYLIKKKGWRYDFHLKGLRHTKGFYKTKTEAKQAEANQRKEVLEPPRQEQGTPTDMAFLALVNRRLDHVKAYNSERHYKDNTYMAKRWVRRWGRLNSGDIPQDMIQGFVLQRTKVSANTANKEIRYLRATFNFGIKKNWISANPTKGIDFLPTEKKLRFIPDPKDVERLIREAETDPWLKARFLDTSDYLWTLRETLGRMSEINQLTWDDVHLSQRYVVLYTRKKRGGNLSPRKVAMTDKLFHVLLKRFGERDLSKPWVFWHPATGKPYKDRKKFMKRLCENAGIPYFRFHSLRHSGASVMDQANIPLGSIQRILGHENRKTTEIYLHGLGESDRRAMEIYEESRTFSHTNSHTLVDFPGTKSA